MAPDRRDMGKIGSLVMEKCEELDAAIIDIAEPWGVIPEVEPLLRAGGRLACYCPTTAQLERCWEAAQKKWHDSRMGRRDD